MGLKSVALLKNEHKQYRLALFLCKSKTLVAIKHTLVTIGKAHLCYPKRSWLDASISEKRWTIKKQWLALQLSIKERASYKKEHSDLAGLRLYYPIDYVNSLQSRYTDRDCLKYYSNACNISVFAYYDGLENISSISICPGIFYTHRQRHTVVTYFLYSSPGFLTRLRAVVISKDQVKMEPGPIRCVKHRTNQWMSKHTKG